ncbi:MAG: hypothetical protein CVU29_11615 [Betaproteobacteria bacterium HGW-Betaproteobacteria-22]|nr:MAG: hypothetical protein CVU29_11615 [Betaproteobacteria bacterium HGW-Betaproteobacteria-22]
MQQKPCPCESGQPYSKCCEVFHSGTVAPNAKTLMRSRYSAYVFGLESYLLSTWHPDTQPEQLSLSGDNAIRWLGLTIKRYAMVNQDNAIVEFVARYKYADKLGEKALRLHETSQFIRMNDRWYYVNGDY